LRAYEESYNNVQMEVAGWRREEPEPD